MLPSVSAIITARGGSKSIIKKNIIDIGGKPLLYWPVSAAISSKYIENIYVDTDCPAIAAVAQSLNSKILLRPDFLSGDTIDHGIVIRNSCRRVLEMHPVDLFVVLLGNTVMIDSCLIDSCIELLHSDPSATGVCSVWKAADDHPMRAMEKGNDGFLYSHSSVIRDSSATTDRSSYLPAYFYDQGVWAFRSENILSDQQCGPSTWNWLGSRVLPYEREWITGRDINGPFDFNFHLFWHLLSATPSNFRVYTP